MQNFWKLDLVVY